ncbi:hypothetical protein DVH26_09600 [Paenibacillus sp. H1-7]|nr:hypothetical protein DVH26_09600 [Paenibacillus sp. H1-7]
MDYFYFMSRMAVPFLVISIIVFVAGVGCAVAALSSLPKGTKRNIVCVISVVAIFAGGIGSLYFAYFLWFLLNTFGVVE